MNSKVEEQKLERVAVSAEETARKKVSHATSYLTLPSRVSSGAVNLEYLFISKAEATLM